MRFTSEKLLWGSVMMLAIALVILSMLYYQIRQELDAAKQPGDFWVLQVTPGQTFWGTTLLSVEKKEPGWHIKLDNPHLANHPLEFELPEHGFETITLGEIVVQVRVLAPNRIQVDRER